MEWDHETRKEKKEKTSAKTNPEENRSSDLHCPQLSRARLFGPILFKPTSVIRLGEPLGDPSNRSSRIGALTRGYWQQKGKAGKGNQDHPIVVF